MTKKEIQHANAMLERISKFQKDVAIFASQLHNTGEIREATVDLLKLSAQALNASADALGIDLMHIERGR